MPNIDPAIFLPIGTIVFLLFLSAFFSGSETALTATSKARMHKLESDGNLNARRVNLLIKNRERLIGAILLGNNLVNILASVIAASVFNQLFGASLIATGLATATMTVLVLVFAEVTPKTAAITRPDTVAMLVAPVMRWVVYILAPVTWLVQMFVRGVFHIFGLDISKDSAVFSAEEELRGAIDLHHYEGRVDKESRDLIRGALDLNEIRTEEIMIHRKSIEMLDIDMAKDALIRQALKSAHTRLPLYRENPDNIIGILHAKDLLRALWDAEGNADAINFEALAREPYFAPETTTLQEQLDAFKVKQEHFALIVDEYGALMGLVTLEDILEEIVGEIEDEYDSPVQGVRPQGDGSLTVDGDVTLRDLNRAMDWNLPDEEAVTVAGLVIHEAQSIPDVGQTFSFYGFRFKILRRRRNQITALKITPIT
ncbi:HlyC/CorC family transporter [Marinicaulis aureus]|uniref:HlyC/CorC family transporter n=1 Tax=Hyphococcus aureus TaxID=2666033 RepID=A0ABW1KU39_9PROT